MSWLTPEANAFLDAYVKAQPPEIVEALKLHGEERVSRFYVLAEAGFKIDVPIMVWNWHPYWTMKARWTAGYTWVPSALEKPVELAPGIPFPGLTEYDPDNPSPNAIMVVNPDDPAQFPKPYEAPVVSLPETSEVYVGEKRGLIWLPTELGRKDQNGQIRFTEDGTKVVKVVTMGMFSEHYYRRA